MGNPFLEDSGDMLILDAQVVMNKDSIQTVNATDFLEGRLKTASNKPLSGIVSNITLALFSRPRAKQRSRSNELGTYLKTNCTLFSRLYIAKLGKATSTVSLNMEIRRALRPFLIW